MIGFVGVATLEVRKRVDTVGALVGFGVLALLVVVCCALSVSLVTRAASFTVGEVLVTTGLPVALAASVVGVVVGVGDASCGGERDGLLAGRSRSAMYLARLAACGVLIAAVVLFAVLVGVVGAGVAVLLGGRAASLEAVHPVVQLAALTFSSAVSGFGIGATSRSLPLGLVSVLAVTLVLDVVLAALGAWTAYIRFGTVQSGLTGEADVLPAVTSGLIWIVLPVLAGWVRAERVAT
ncbi:MULTISPECIES: hypothetical protein [unclassified Curtobacterium]|uniref:hypothetical protein n=1 Tax=unclassified Curtobacterium TaxID=257496 RepID=UPI000D85B39E|nr:MULTISPECIES: hypothetical protein [unclassified Curtobacterium]PYY34848.1 hypothetical protein DEI89_08135 [Curtobacterium sp. MCBD17_030]PZE37712.1 hypothetical protein DEJ31_06105 [Curtobacterium sp. MCPF17_031]PZF15308.1 hypothetical protein DEJ25_00795 [Curtobacterium sp. MCPF17_011]